MTAMLPIARAEPLPLEGWKPHLVALGAAWAVTLILFHADAIGIVSIWLGSSTFKHCIFIPPLIAWLIRQRLPELRELQPAAWWPGLLAVAAGAAAWLLGDAGSLAVARHLGLILMLQGMVVACLGKAVARGILFPLLYAFFLVPAGEELIPLMQTVTAKMCMGLLAMIGIPARLDGIFITTPAGYFKVAEACAGVNFLIAMLAYGALAANICFRSWRRRAAFVAAAIIIPILANGLRAAGTIYIAGKAGIAFAAGFDHILYGWIFFAIVMALLTAAGWPFFDRGRDDPWFDPRALQAEDTPPAPARNALIAAAAALAIAAFAPAWSAAIASTGSRPPPARFALPQVAGWQQVSAEKGRPWQPHYVGADLVRTARYRDAGGREVDLAVIVFARQQEGKELVGYGQGAAAPDGPWSWTADSPSPPNGKAERISSSGTPREVLTFYRVGQIVTGSAAAVKLETIRARLLGGPQRAAAVLVSAEGGEGLDPRPAIDSFVAALGPVDRLADEAAGLPQTR
jgi:exosortase A